MNLVFCMAGRYQRFRDAGYTEPKFLLSWRGRPLLQQIIGALLDPVVTRVLLVAHRRDEGYLDQILAILADLDLPADSIAFIDDTEGQADTALAALDLLDQRWQPTDRRVVFHNIDTLLLDRDWAQISAALADYDGWIDTFEADRNCYSYVQTDVESFVTVMREKEVISAMATTGMYGFGSIEAFREAHAACLGSFGGERYISTIYQHLVDQGARIVVGHQSTDETTLIFGTPAEYEAWLAHG